MRTDRTLAAAPNDAFIAVAATTCAGCGSLITPGVSRIVVRHSLAYHAEHAPEPAAP